MLAAALFASLLAQAEQAPPPGPAEPAPVGTGAAAPSPAPAPAAPAPIPSAPAPPAAPLPPPVVAQPAPPAPPNSVSVHVRYAYRLDNGGDGLVMRLGYTLVWSGWQGDLSDRRGNVVARLGFAERALSSDTRSCAA